MTYPIAFRQHVLAYKQKHGLTFEETGEHFDISMRSLLRWNKNIEPCAKKNRPSIKLCMETLKKDVEDFPDDYQWERAKRFGVSQPSIHDALKRLNKSYKKNTVPPQSR
ncbi:IS630 transposase-related protein [Aliikangiella sp. IMCC44359]|uniref:IS630 transposase-related protein n=1 Tax=Aliikangiella sp. IMCC44359 TaxID=3459125 RepID=UPI00403A87AD